MSEQPTPMPEIRAGEWVEVVDEEYRYRGEVRHRQKRVRRYTACCLNCYETTEGPLWMDVRAWGRTHRCAS